MSARRALVEHSAGTASLTLTTPAITAVIGARRAMPAASEVYGSTARRALRGEGSVSAPRARRALPEPLEQAAPQRARRAAEQIVPVGLTIGEDSPERAFIKSMPSRGRRRGNSRIVAASIGLAAVIGTISGGLAITNSAVATGTASPYDATTETIDPDTVVGADTAAETEETPEVVEVAPITVDISAPKVDPASITAPGQKAPLSTEEAIEKAKSMVGNQNYGNMCLALSAAFYGYSSAGVNSATDAAAAIEAAGQMHKDMDNIPVGALIWYDGGLSGNPYGHVAMYAGDGMIYSNGAPTGVGLIPLDEPATSWHEPIIGWSTVWLPSATG